MFWADRIAGEIEKRFGKAARPLLIRDEKTVSGRVHVGSMRGVAIHGVMHEVLGEKGISSNFIYEFNDFDPMDDIPPQLEWAKYAEFLGKPLYTIPAPEGSAKNFGEYYANEFLGVINSAGWQPTITWASELYLSGRMDGVIREALEHADDVRRIMKEVSGADRKEGWLPISVICPQCGKMTTTEATNFDGETVEVLCRENKVEYTKGCNYTGRVSPFGGKAKLYWKTDWPAKWKVYGVQIEGAGKDHSTKGGSRDVGNHIARDVYHYEPPFDMPYEFFLVGGKKMSSSKGRGSSAKEISDLLPAKIFRLALLSKDIMHAFSFDPEGDTIPVLYDQYDKLAEQYKTLKDDDYAQLFELIHPGGEVRLPQGTLPRFSQVAFVVQMPHMDIYKEFPDADRAELDERARYAKHWLELYAPEKFVFKLQDKLPEVAQSLSDTSKTALTALQEFIASRDTMPTGEEIHTELHKTKEFKAVYLAFLGKDSGPKAGWFLSSLPREFVLARLKEAIS